MQVTAAVSRDAGADFTVEQLELDAPQDNEVLVKIVGVGVCHTDIAARDQAVPTHLPAVLGHEGSGIVEQVGAAVTSVKPGDHVVLSYTSCDHCIPCEHDHRNYCQQFLPLNFLGMRGDGTRAFKSSSGEVVSSHFFGQSSFSSYALASENCVVKVRDDAPLDMLGPLGCGIQTGAGTFMRGFACEAGSAVAVTGGGAVGLSAVMGAVVQGCGTIIVVEPHASRRELALELGATHVIDPADGSITEAIRAIVPNGLDYALDTTAKRVVISALLGAMASGGTLGFVGVPGTPDDAVLQIDVITMLATGVKLKGICEGDAEPAEFVPVMVDLFMEGKFPFDKLCDFYDFAEINEAVHAQHRGDCIKAILRVAT